ncbi:MAG: GAF domain-containing protein [Chlorobi bacterium]|nr:GAF domain-containing protein [Chlorobiota bacterium]
MQKNTLYKYRHISGIAIISLIFFLTGLAISVYFKKTKTSDINNKQTINIRLAENILFGRYAKNTENITAARRMITYFLENSDILKTDSTKNVKITAQKQNKRNIQKTFNLHLTHNIAEINEQTEKFTLINNTFFEIWQKSGDNFVRIASSKPEEQNKFIFINKNEHPATEILKGEETTAEQHKNADLKIIKTFPLYTNGKINFFIKTENNESISAFVSKLFSGKLIYFDKDGKLLTPGKNPEIIPEEITITPHDTKQTNEIIIKKLPESTLYLKYIPEFSAYFGFFTLNSKINAEIKKQLRPVKTILFIAALLFITLFLLYDKTNTKYRNTVNSKLKKLMPENKNTQNPPDALKEYLTEIKQITTNIANGKYLTEQKKKYKDDSIINKLETIRKKFLEIEKQEKLKLAEEKETTKFNKAASQISEILQYASDIKDLSAKIIKKIAEFTGAEQIALFTVTEDIQGNKSLEMSASFAYSKQRTTDKTLEVTEGLLGRAYLEKQSIFLTEIPENYMFIESGFGFQKPGCILIVPLIFNNEVQAIIELGSIKILDEKQIKFIEKTGENIASTIANLKHSKQTEILLKQTREQSKQIEIQRKTLEEKINTHRKQNRNLDKQILQLIEIIDSIKSVSYLIEYDLKGTVMDVSTKVIKLFDVNKETFISKSHKDIIEETDYYKKYDTFWKDLSSGKTQYTEETISVGNKKIKMKQTYVPIKNVRRKIYRILSIGIIKE